MNNTLNHDVLTARDLYSGHGKHMAVRGLNLAVRAGSVYALLGGNGAGKTTTISTFLGIVRIGAGEVRIGGRSLAEQPDAVRELAYLPENVALYPYLSGAENLRYFSAIAGVSLTRSEACDLLVASGLAGTAVHARASTYSKGMRQKVGLAIAHARKARGMLLDEPTSGLDPSAANEFAARLRAAADAGLGVLMATHDLFNAKQVADRIGIMKDGVIVSECDARTVGHQELEDMYLAFTRGMA